MAHAAEMARSQGHDHLDFRAGDALALVERLPFQPSVAVASLFLRALSPEPASALLRRLSGIARRILIADIADPRSPLRRAFLHLDECPAGHHRRYVSYRRAGGMRALLAAPGLQPSREEATESPLVRIWTWDAPGSR